MAFKRYKRFRYRKARKNRYRRRRAVRYSRRRGAKRSWRNRRFPRGTEVKSVANHQQVRWDVSYTRSNVTNVTWYEYPMRTFVFPAPERTLEYGSVTAKQTNNMDVADGTGISERIGGKIKPIKLRIYGSMAINDAWLNGQYPVLQQTVINQQVPAQGASAREVMESDVRLAFAVRLFVYQVRGGNSNKHPQDKDYHPLALENVVLSDRPATPFGNASQVKKLLAAYQGTDTVQTFENLLDNISAVNQPLRLGLGGQFRMLYTKVYYLSSIKPARPFRIVTKVPRRLVWPEIQDGGNDIVLSNYARNAIYVAWLLIPLNPPSKFPPSATFGVADASVTERSVDLSYHVQMFYTDK